MIAGLLFLALVYFAVGQAAMTRNGAQTAADSAALAAAQDARSQLREGWFEVIGDPAQWQRFVRGEEYAVGRACRSAGEFAALNDAELLPGGCAPSDLGFTVTVRTRGTVGDSIVPGTDGQHATATASAVVEPLCTFDPPEPTSAPTPDPDPSSTPSGEPEEPEEEEPVLISGLTCDGETWEIDPEDPVLPGVEDLFRVRLTDDE
ncbi:pilus assembly protein TadG-related protein [Streptomyces termitum]